MSDETDASSTIIDVDVSNEMETSYLEYAYSVIYSRALPDARDGLKPVQRRIVYQMAEMGLRPDRGHVKSSRVIGEVMGKLHPHGDTAIYDALVRLSQDFTMRVALVDGHGNFGSLDDGPAAARYTEARLTKAAMAMVAGLGEDVVDFIPNYDNTLTQPERLPSAFPNLLVNGASGIAVGMATNMPTHNLGEVVAAARHLIDHPDATLDDLMKFVPGPDFPSGGRIIGLDGVREAYATGRGSFKTRATVSIENVTARKKGIVVTELPYLVGPEKVSDKIRAAYKAGKLTGVTNIDDFSDRHNGLRLVIELKNGFNPDAVLEQLYRFTPMEDSFGINNVTLVDGQPRVLGLKELLEVYVEHRLAVVKRRSQFRLAKNEARLHLVEGLLIAIADIDEVIQLIRSSDDAATAKSRLQSVFDLSEAQATYILDLQLRRLTKFSTIDLEAERDELHREIDRLRGILADESLLRQVVSDELGEAAEEFATPRRTVLLESAPPTATGKAGKAGKNDQPATPLEIPDEPCWVLLSTSGLIARSSNRAPLPAEGKRAKHDALISQVAATARGEIGAVTSTGRLIRLPVVDMPTLPPVANRVNLAGGASVREFMTLDKKERLIGLVSLDDGPGFALGTAHGVVKRATPDVPGNKDDWDVIALKDGDGVVGVTQLESDDDELVFVSSDARLLHFEASKVRPQGRAAAGVAGMKLSPGASVVFFGAVHDAAEALVATASSGEGSAGTMNAKVTPLSEYPAKGRATGGVRAHRFLKGETALDLAWVGTGPSAASTNGVARVLPIEFGRRDGSGVPLERRIDAIGGAPVNPEAADATDSATGPRKATEEEKEAIARQKPSENGVVITDDDNTLF